MSGCWPNNTIRSTSASLETSHRHLATCHGEFGLWPFERLKEFGVYSANPVDGLWNFAKFPALA